MFTVSDNLPTRCYLSQASPAGEMGADCLSSSSILVSGNILFLCQDLGINFQCNFLIYSHQCRWQSIQFYTIHSKYILPILIFAAIYIYIYTIFIDDSIMTLVWKTGKWH